MQKVMKRRIYAGLIVVFCVLYYVVVVRGSYVCHYFNQVSRHELQQLPVLAAPTPSDRILIFAPHPDDETLACAGLIQQALRAGAKVHVVFMTNGDAFMRAIKMAFHINDVTPTDAVNFGNLRRTEALHAGALLGLIQSDITFLGYPDKGLTLMWYYHWSPVRSYRSLISHTRVNPYKDAPGYDTPYCGANVMDDVDKVIRSYKPTKVFTVMSGDQHIDHDGTALYVNSVLTRIAMHDSMFAKNCQLFGYIIHYTDWPYPRGQVDNGYMAPPREMMNCGMKWFRLPLSVYDEKIKSTALNKYESQMRDDALLLTSFVRRNEVFVRMPLGVDAYEPTICKEPSDDCIIPRFGKGIDIVSVKLQRSTSCLDVTLKLNGDVNRNCEYRCAVRAVDLDDAHQSVIKTKNIKGDRSGEQQVTFRFSDLPKNSMLCVTASSYLDAKLQDRMLDKFIR